VIEPTRAQLSLAEGLIEEEVGALWEEWKREVDQLLGDQSGTRSDCLRGPRSAVAEQPYAGPARHARGRGAAAVAVEAHA